MMTARRRARATRAFLRPRRLAIFMAHAFRAKVSRLRVRIELAAFVEQLAHHTVALLGDSSGPVELARLMASGHQAQVGASVA